MFSKARAMPSFMAGVLYQPRSLSSLLEGREKNQQAERAKLFVFSVETFCWACVSFAEAVGECCGERAGQSPLWGALEVVACVLLAYFSIVHVECDTPDFRGCLSNASHLYQWLAFNLWKDAALGTSQEFAKTLWIYFVFSEKEITKTRRNLMILSINQKTLKGKKK